MTRRALAGCVALVAAAGLVRGDAAPVTPKPLVLTPAAAPAPALKHALLPPLRDQKPGNAAPLYRQAGKTLAARRTFLDDPGYARASRWLEMSRERLRREVAQAKEYLKPLDPVYEEVEAAARREGCDWGLLEEFRKDDFVLGDTFNDVQKVRECTFFLQLRARVALADDRPGDALRDAQTVFAMSRHLTQAPTAIHALVATAIANIGAGIVEAIVQHPKAPNLYWALTDLPCPFIDLRQALQGERLMFFGNFPGLAKVAADPNAGPVPPEKIERYGKQLTEKGFLRTDVVKDALPAFARLVPGLENASFRSETLDTIRFGMVSQHQHEAAKRVLMESGRPRDKVERMPPLQVALLHAGIDHERLLDEVQKWQNFPYWQAEPAMEALRKKIRASSTLLPEAPALRIAPLSVPLLSKTLFARARAERQFAALRCVEAVRLYAAAHDGKLPPTLDAIKEVPVPIDPLTGKAFEYRVEGDRARLSAVVTPMDYRPAVPDYQLTVRR